MAIFNFQAPKASFSLRNIPDKQGRKALYIKFFIDGKYVMKSTDIWLKPRQWDSVEQLVINSAEANELNKILYNLKEKTERLIRQNYGESVTADDIRTLLSEKDPEQKPRRDFIEYAKEVNHTLYNKGKYGYRSWHSKDMNIDMFANFVHEKLEFRTLYLDSLQVTYFDKYIAYRLNERKNKSREGINKTLVPLYEAIKYAVKTGEIEAPSVAAIVDNYISIRETKYSTKISESKVRFLTEDQMKQLADFWKSQGKGSRKDALDMFFFSFYSCGLRISDLVTLEWRHADLKEKQIKKVQVKTKKAPSVTIPLTDSAMEILSRWKGRNSKYVFDCLAEDFDIKNEEALVRKINSWDKIINGHLTRTSTTLSFPLNLTIHMARHTFAVIALNNGVDVYMISKLLGHSSIVATEKTYAEFLKEKVTDDAHRVLDLQF